MSGSNALADAFANANRPTVPIQSPFELMRQAGENAHLMNANRLFQAQQAAGAAQQNAIGPDGTYSPERFRQNLLAAGPVAAPAAQSSLAANQALSSDQLNQARDKLSWVAKASGAALTAGDYSDAGMLKVLTQGSADGILTMPEIVKQLGSMPADAAGRKAWLEQHQNQAMSTQQQLELRYGKPIIGDTGQQLLGGTQAVQGGALNIPQQPGVQLQTGPGANAALIEVSDAAGNKYNVPRMSLPGASGVTGRVRAPADYSGQPNPLLGGLPNPPENGAPAGATLSSIGPAKSAALTTTGGQSAGAFKEVSDQGVAAQSRGAVLDNMLSDTSQFTSGPGTDAIARVRAVANRLGLNVNTEGLSAVESFKKLAAALNANQGSDARLLVSEASNPHADMSPAGVDLMIRQLRGNEDYNLARAKLAATYPDKTDKTGFEAKIGARLDPRTFQYDRMTPGQKSTFFKSIDDKDKFIKAHDAATALLGGR